jgi:hypothetical protein
MKFPNSKVRLKGGRKLDQYERWLIEGTESVQIMYVLCKLPNFQTNSSNELVRRRNGLITYFGNISIGMTLINVPLPSVIPINILIFSPDEQTRHFAQTTNEQFCSGVTILLLPRTSLQQDLCEGSREC